MLGFLAQNNMEAIYQSGWGSIREGFTLKIVLMEGGKATNWYYLKLSFRFSIQFIHFCTPKRKNLCNLYNYVCVSLFVLGEDIKKLVQLLRFYPCSLAHTGKKIHNFRLDCKIKEKVDPPAIFCVNFNVT